MSADTATKVGVRIPLAEGSALEAHACIPVFHRWIREGRLPEMLIDVADYSHVPDGPGVLLVSHEAYYGVDAPGLHYEVRRPEALGAADARQALRSALASALAAIVLLEGDTTLAGPKFRTDQLEVAVLDRRLAPNTDATFTALEPTLRTLFTDAFGTDAFELQRLGQARQMFKVRVTCAGAPAAAELGQRLAGMASH